MLCLYPPTQTSLESGKILGRCSVCRHIAGFFCPISTYLIFRLRRLSDRFPLQDDKASVKSAGSTKSEQEEKAEEEEEEKEEEEKEEPEEEEEEAKEEVIFYLEFKTRNLATVGYKSLTQIRNRRENSKMPTIIIIY